MSTTRSDFLAALAGGLGPIRVRCSLLSEWRPSDDLRRRLATQGIELRHHPLQSIPADALEANRSYHIWSGTPLQAEEFRKTVCAPTRNETAV